MSQRHRITALLTANVFQNGLSRHEQSWRYYTDLLRRLPSQPVNWYISALDYDLAFSLWDIYEMGGDPACQEAYSQMREILGVCPVDSRILDGSGFPHLNFYDAIRLACAFDRGVDAIVTWEPSQFAPTTRQRKHAQEHGCFELSLKTRLADDDSSLDHTIGIFTVATFLLHLDKLENPQSLDETESRRFQLEQLQFNADDSRAEVRVFLRNWCGELMQEAAIGSTPGDALCRAVDSCIDRYILLPQRNIIHLTMPDVIGGADAPVDLMLTVECDRRTFRASSNNPNVIRAFGDAYVDVINQICLKLNVNRT